MALFSRQLGAMVLVMVVAIMSLSFTTPMVAAIQFEDIGSDMLNSHAFRSALAEIDAQVAQHMAVDPESSATEGSVEQELGLSSVSSQMSPPRFKSTVQEVVSALNGVDFTSIEKIEPSKPEVQTRQSLQAFVAIAQETISRSSTAIVAVYNYYMTMIHYLKHEKTTLDKWVEAQKRSTNQRIEAEVNKIARLRDEISNLQNIYQDAVAKDRSYQTELNQLMTERQLQKTPPILPAVAASTMPEQQYNEVVARLTSWRQAAGQVIAQTTNAISERQKMVTDSENWIKAARAALEKWVATQTSVINDRVKRGQETLEVTKKRYEALIQIKDDATTKMKEYQNALQKITTSDRVKYLQGLLDRSSGLKPTNAYEDAKLKTYIQSLNSEIGVLQKQIDGITTDLKLTPPPHYWGILSGFPARSVRMSNYHDFFPSAGYGYGAPDDSLSPNDALSPIFPSAIDQSVRSPVSDEPAPKFEPQSAGAPSPPSFPSIPTPETVGLPSFREVSPTAAATSNNVRSSFPAPPPVPKLPPPPDSETARNMLG